MVAAYLSGRNIACSRGGRLVFANLSFTLDSGEAMFLIGPNGSGKSSFLRLLAGLSHPVTGYLLRKNGLINETSENHTALVRYIGHQDAVKSTWSVSETLSFWARLVGLNKEKARQATMLAMSIFGLSQLSDVPGQLLSAGQKRRLNLARLVLGISDLWLLDEPTTALDQAAIDVLAEIVAKHRSDGGIVVLATHVFVDVPGAQLLDMCDFAAIRKERSGFYHADNHTYCST